MRRHKPQCTLNLIFKKKVYYGYTVETFRSKYIGIKRHAQRAFLPPSSAGYPNPHLPPGPPVEYCQGIATLRH